jgi:alpha-galactosidase
MTRRSFLSASIGAGVQGHRVAAEGPLEVWVKSLADGSKGVGLFNRSGDPEPITVHFHDIEMATAVRLRDLWLRKDLGTFNESYTAVVPRHGVVLLKATALY